MQSVFIKPRLLLLLCHLPVGMFCQEAIQGKWTFEYGASTSSLFKHVTSANVRYISPRFKIFNDDWTEEMEKHPEKYKRARIMLELIYAPPFKEAATSFYVQYRLLKLKRLTLEVYGGVKFFFVTGPDFMIRPEYVKSTYRGVWFVNEGLIAQLNLGVIAPFADIGYDRMLTVGAEVNLHAIYKKPKRRYRLKNQPVNKIDN